MACGKPIIATACGGPENIVTVQNGYLIHPNNIDELGTAMQTMITNYHSFNGDHLKEECIAKFGSASFAIQMKRLYLKTIPAV